MEAPRRCGRCEQRKPAEAFNWRRKKKDQRDNMCRPCRSAYKHEHYTANKVRYVAQAAASKRRLRAKRTIDAGPLGTGVRCGL